MLIAFILALAAVAAAILTPVAASAGPQPAPTCSAVRLPVALAGDDPRRFEVAGQLCLPRETPTTVQLLVPGATYGRAYWDFPVAPERQSWVWHMTAAGYATLALDRIGTGASSHPPPEDVTVTSSAFVVHQVIGALRSGELDFPPFTRVVLVGHSLGSVIALSEAAAFDDADLLVLTGFLHRIDSGFGELTASFHPARFDDARFRDLPPGYLTTRPGERKELFYYEPTSEAGVVAADEATKETITDGEAATLGRHLHEASMRISIPVLISVGDRDRVFCASRRCSEAGGAAQDERSLWSTECYHQQVVPDTGHSLNLHRTALEWFAGVADWLRANGPDQVPAGCRRSAS